MHHRFLEFFGAFALLATGCSTIAPDADAPGAEELQSPEADVAPERQPSYPPGRWRIADPRLLDRVMLWFSHLSIRHEGVPANVVSFDHAGWRPAETPSLRTRQQALELARSIARQAQSHPAQFATIAEEYSEDSTTKDRGGSLGGSAASEWYPFPRVLDALAALRPGDVSDVVETQFGFHVFQRRAPPPRETVSGARIIIAYDEAPWLHEFLARRAIPKRSRAEALALAQRVYERAREAPERFAELVAEFSDHEEALRSGDFGAWNTHEPSPFPVAVEVLQSLAVGEVAPPLDSPFGVQIIQRSAERPRGPYAMASIQQRFDPAVPAEAPNSQQAAFTRLRALSAMIRANPSRFDEVRERDCCLGLSTWSAGQGSVIEEKALDLLAPGEVSAEPVLLKPDRVALFKRLEAIPEPPVIGYELPAPLEPDIAYYFSQTNALNTAQAAARGALGLTGATEARYAELHDIEGRLEHARDDVERLAIFWQLQTDVRQLLGEGRYATYLRLIKRQLASEQLPEAQ